MSNVSATALMESLVASEAYQIEGAKIDFAMELKRLMDQKGLNNAGLASVLGVSRPMVTKLLSGDSNVTIESMAKAAYKLDSRIFIKLVRKDAVAKLFEVARCGEQFRSHELANAVRNRVPNAQVNRAWFQSANDVESDEAEPIAA